MFYRPAAVLPEEVLRARNAAFTRSAWRAGTRPDCREPHQLRELEVVFPTLSRDLVQVRCGATTVTASVYCELVEPSPYKPKHGFFEIRVRQLLHERDGAQKTRHVRTLNRFLERLFKGSVVETEGLCVLPGRRVWSLAVEVMILNDEGNVRDVIQWAVLAALQHFRRPELTIRGDSVVIHPPHERDPVPLSLHHLPVAVSFAVTLDPQAIELEMRATTLRRGQRMLSGVSTAAPQGASGPTRTADEEGQGVASLEEGEEAKESKSSLLKSAPAAALPSLEATAALERENEVNALTERYVRLAVDPTADEELAAASHIVTAVNAEGQVCALEKGEGCDVPWTLLESSVEVATQLVPKVLQIMKDAMVAHETKRKEAVRGQFLWAAKRLGVGKSEASTAEPAGEPDVKKTRTES